MSVFEQMGFMSYPLTLVTIFMLIQVGRGIFDVARSDASGEGTLRIHSVLVLGVLGACLGVLGTLVGLYLAGDWIQRAGEASLSLVAGGVAVALTTSIFGLLILGFASIAWLVLQYARGRRDRAAASSAWL